MARITVRVTYKQPKGGSATGPQVNSRQILKEIVLEGPKYISKWIQVNKPFQSRTGFAATKWAGEILGDHSVRIASLMPYSYWLNFGVRSHQMTYLLNSPMKQYWAFGKYPYMGRAPIPIPVMGGFAFRVPTAKAMAQGKWVHPGYQGTHFLEKA